MRNAQYPCEIMHDVYGYLLVLLLPIYSLLPYSAILPTDTCMAAGIYMANLKNLVIYLLYHICLRIYQQFLTAVVDSLIFSTVNSN